MLEAEPAASLYYGFTHEISKEEFERRIQDNTLTDVLNAVPVHKGDCFFIPSGTLHAIRKGIVVAEIQQNRRRWMLPSGSRRKRRISTAIWHSAITSRWMP